MQLRNSITVPTRLQDEEPATPNNRNGTKPTHPQLMKAKAVPFNPDNPPAAFPSLAVTSQAVTVADRNVSEEMATDDPDRLNSLLAQNSLAGNSSAIEGHHQSQERRSQVDLMTEEDTNQHDGTRYLRSARNREVARSLRSQPAKSSFKATQVIKTPSSLDR